MTQQASIDLSQRHFQTTRHGITMIGTWLDLGDAYQACAALIRAGEEFNEHTQPYIITSNILWKWADETGDARFIATQLHAIMETLRLSFDERTSYRLMMFINDRIGDILGIPPFPPKPRDAVAEVTITNTATGHSREGLV